MNAELTGPEDLFNIGPLILCVVASSAGLIPSTQGVPGWMVWGRSKAFLEKSGVVTPPEEVIYLYSHDPLSFEAEGSILTGKRVISYWTDETGAFFIEAASFDELQDVRVEKGDWPRPTVLTVIRKHGSNFVLVLSAQNGRDRLFVRRLNEFRHH